MPEELLNNQGEEVAEGADDSTAETTEGAQAHNEQELKYTDADVDKIIARKIAAERKRFSKLFEEQNKESELVERERKVLERELKANARDALVAEGLPVTLANIMNFKSEEEYNNSFEEITSIFRKALQEKFITHLSAKAPFASTSDKGTVEINREKALHDAFAPKSH